MLCLFLFQNGRLILQQEVAYAELRYPSVRSDWARRLAELGAPLDLPPVTRLEPALLDEIQIVTAWMKQKTREGAYWQFPVGQTTSALAGALDAWLAEQASVSGEHREAA